MIAFAVEPVEETIELQAGVIYKAIAVLGYTVATLCVPLDASGQVLTESVKLLASDGVAFDEFGTSVYTSGDLLIVGAHQAASDPQQPGAAYIFRFNGSTWVEEQKLAAAGGAAKDEFGEYVALSGDVAVVGAWLDDDKAEDAGSVYVFRHDQDEIACGQNWCQEQQLWASDGAAFDQFGTVSISNGVIVAGAFKHDEMGIEVGSAYVFRFDSTGTVCGKAWCEEKKLLAFDREVSDAFGSSVAVSGDTVFVSAGGGEGVVNGSGAVYVYYWTGADWEFEQKIFASDGFDGQWFGRSLSVSEDRLLVGAWLDDEIGYQAGAAYVFRRDPTQAFGAQWSEEQKLLAMDGAPGDIFGNFVSLSGIEAAVGSIWDDCSAGVECGAAYLFRFDGASWNQVEKLVASGRFASHGFGPVALSGETVLVGAYGDDDNGANAGAAYYFSLADCNGNGVSDTNEATTTRNYCVKCDSPSPPNDCSNATSWSFLLDWLGAGPNFEELNCGPVTPISGSTAADMAQAFADCINATVCPSIAAIPFGSGRCLRVTVPGVVRPDICVGPAGGPSDACCPNPPCVFNPTLVEVTLAESDCNKNGDDDAVDIVLGTSPDSNEDGIPDECGACCHAGECDQLIAATCSGFGSYQGNATICAEQCPTGIPAVSQWGFVCLTVAVLAVATIILRRRIRVPNLA